VFKKEIRQGKRLYHRGPDKTVFDEAGGQI